MPQGKQAKVLTERDLTRLLEEVARSRYPVRDRVAVLLSVRAGLRAKEIAAVTWAMVLDQDGQVAEVLELVDKATKGERGGRLVALHPQLRAALVDLHGSETPERQAFVIRGERDGTVSARGLHKFFERLYGRLNLAGCSSHSGRRTFITQAARLATKAGASLREVQELAGHASLQTTQRYIQADSDAKRNLVALLGTTGK